MTKNTNENESHSGEELVTAPALCRRMAISDMSLWRRLKRGIIPPPIVICGRRYWKRSTIDAWFAALGNPSEGIELEGSPRKDAIGRVG